jgi:hypothetical protein
VRALWDTRPVAAVRWRVKLGRGAALVCALVAAACTTGGNGETAGLAGESLRINELCPSNNQSSGVDTGPLGVRADYIELFNPTDTPVRLDGWFFSDDEDDPFQYFFPAGTGEVGPGDFRLLLADDELTEDFGQGELHLPFRLHADAEQAVLSDPEGERVDSVRFSGAAPGDVFARCPDGGEFVVLTASSRPVSGASPGTTNAQACTTQTSE